MIALVELVRRYSNRADLHERLQQACLRAKQAAEQEHELHEDTVSGRVSGVWRVRDRLTEEEIEQLMAEFVVGVSKRELADRYNLSFGAVKDLLRRHGVRRTNHSRG